MESTTNFSIYRVLVRLASDNVSFQFKSEGKSK
jgi:hypothetical protein